VIQDLDDTLYRLFVSRLTTLGSAPPTADQIRLQPPDSVWRQHVTNNLGTLNGLNVYLADVRENRALRTNETERSYDATGRFVLESASPTRVDCHYLITAWSTATDDPTDANRASSSKTGEEHAILSEVASVLLEEQPLVPAEVFGGSPPAGFAPAFAEAELPTRVLPVDGFPKYGEFWSSLDEPHPWKPAVYLVVTIPIAAGPQPSGPRVTTLSATYSQNGRGRETLVDIGGRALDASGAVVPAALVRLLDAGGATVLRAVETDDEGRFRLDRLVPGTYRLQAGAPGAGSADDPLDVPSPTGDYDVRLT
jgi:Pvc16 N-terminal domain/Carboxypeptidase regulatory-like domain